MHSFDETSFRKKAAAVIEEQPSNIGRDFTQGVMENIISRHHAAKGTSGYSQELEAEIILRINREARTAIDITPFLVNRKYLTRNAFPRIIQAADEAGAELSTDFRGIAEALL